MNTALTLASVPAILALVQLAKSLGLSGKWSALVAVILGVLLNVATYALGDYGWYQAAASGLILGLSAAGLYDTARIASPTTTTYTPEH